MALHANNAALSCQAFFSIPVYESLWDRQIVAMPTVFVLWLGSRLLRQQPQRAVSTVGEEASPLSLHQGHLSSAQKVPRNDATGGRRGSRGRKKRREGPEISSTSLSLRTASRDPVSASPSMQIDFLMKRDAPHPTRWICPWFFSHCKLRIGTKPPLQLLKNKYTLHFT